MGEDKKRILVVDDEQDIRFTLSRRLMVTGYDVVTAENGADALEKVKQQAFDLVICDVMMPVMNGFEFCEACKEDPSVKDVPVIMLTALNQKEHVVKAVQSGARDYAIKPIDDKALISKVEKHLGDQEKEKPNSFSHQVVRGGLLDRDRVDRLVEKIDIYSYSSEIKKYLDGRDSLEDLQLDELVHLVETDPLIAFRILQVAREKQAKDKKSHLNLKNYCYLLGVDTAVSLLKKWASEKGASQDDQLAISLMRLRSHSLACANLCYKLAELTNFPHPDLAFQAGLFHCVGRFILIHHYPEEYMHVIKRAEQENTSSRDIEKKFFGVDHTFVGYRFLDYWKFPHDLYFAVFHQHHESTFLEASRSEEYDLARLVYFSVLLSQAAGWPSSLRIFNETVPQIFWDFYHWEYNIISKVIDKVSFQLMNQLRRMHVLENFLPTQDPRCQDRSVVVYHTQSEPISFIALNFEQKGARTVRVQGPKELASSLQENPGVPLVIDAPIDGNKIPQLDHPLVQPYIDHRRIVVVSKNRVERDEIERDKMLDVTILLKPVLYEEIVQTVFQK